MQDDHTRSVKDTTAPVDPFEQRRRLQDHAHQYIAQEWTVLAGRRDDGHPGWEWSTRPGLTPAEVSDNVKATHQLFLRGGDAKLLGIDLDTPPERGPAIVNILGWHTMMDGRPSKPVSHLYLLCDDIPKDFTVSDEGSIEIRGERHITMVAPSQHHSGEYLALLPDHGIDAIATVPWKEIEAKINWVRAANMIANAWVPKEQDGRLMARHELALYLAGWLLPADCPVDRVKQFITDVARVANDPDGIRDDYTRAVDDTRETIDRGDVYAGYSKLAMAFTDAQLQAIGAWLDLPDRTTFTPKHSRNDFLAFLEDAKFIYRPTRRLWPSRSIDETVAWPQIGRQKNGKPIYISPSRWLMQNQHVQVMTWAPGEAEVIEGRLLDRGGWIERSDGRMYNMYRGPVIGSGDPKRAVRWLNLVKKVFPNDWQHIVAFLAHRVQRPGEKINHMLVLGGKPGIGKDTILEPLKPAIGPWNFEDISPVHVFGNFNGYVKSVILRVSEMRDLGDKSRYDFYERMKTLAAAPPDVHLCNEKHLREYPVPNVCGVIGTTNYKTTGMYLPLDDRRTYVAWSALSHTDFKRTYWDNLYAWFEDDGVEHVTAYLMAYDLSAFKPKAPPPKTAAFWEIAHANTDPRSTELEDLLHVMESPDVVSISSLTDFALNGRSDNPFENRQYGSESFVRLSKWLTDVGPRVISAHLEQAGYPKVANPTARDGVWKIGGRRTTLYAKDTLSERKRIAAARAFIEQEKIR